MKSILSAILSIVIMLSTLPPVCAGAETAAEPQFSCDFSKGNFYWNTANGSAVMNEKLVFPDGWSRVTLNSTEITWDEFTFEFDFKLTAEPKEPTDNWFMFGMRGVNLFSAPALVRFMPRPMTQNPN